MKYEKTVVHRGMIFRGHFHKKRGLVIYRPKQGFTRYYNSNQDTIGILALGIGWQDLDRTYTFQDIYWEDKYDCQAEQREAA